ncbi:GH43 family beta-xylosidase [Pedobacter sp. UYP30]|uniref:glycoside hydrolase family 43 protein n=1 Tax=Pedobacter sp. UYP30 TaxID=1756400 RepID=UPI003391C2A8
MRNCRLIFLITLFFITAIFQLRAQTFTNPLLHSGPDPYSLYKDGYYYYTSTLGNKLGLWKTKNIADLKSATYKTVYQPPAGMLYSKELWAPEIQYLNNKWYMYFAADDGLNDHHRMYVVENSSADPLSGTWVFKGKLAAQSDKWAIDGDVFKLHEQLYMIWSGWEGDVNGQQNIYIVKMKNPWIIEGERTKISSPEFAWEKYGDLKEPKLKHVNVNEGPQFLAHGDKVFVIYSASGCWTDHYALGMLSAKANSDLLNPKSWTKHRKPVFKESPENGVYAPGHNSFFKSPNGKEDWILYHANSEAGQGCGITRSPRAQKFTWDKKGFPVFGKPVKTSQVLAIPAQ